MAVTVSEVSKPDREDVGFWQGWYEYLATMRAVWSCARTGMFMYVAFLIILIGVVLQLVDVLQREYVARFNEAFHGGDPWMMVFTLLIIRFAAYYLYSSIIEWIREKIGIKYLFVPLARKMAIELMRRAQRLSRVQHQAIDLDLDVGVIPPESRGISLTMFREKTIDLVRVHVIEPAVFVICVYLWIVLLIYTPLLFVVVILCAIFKMAVLLWANNKIKPLSKIFSQVVPKLEKADINMYQKIYNGTCTEEDFRQYSYAWDEYARARIERDLRINWLYNLCVELSTTLTLFIVTAFGAWYYVFFSPILGTGEAAKYTQWAFRSDDFLNMFVQVMKRWATDRPFFINALKICGWWDEVYRPPVR